MLRSLLAVTVLFAALALADKAPPREGKRQESPFVTVGVMAALDEASAQAQAKALAVWVKTTLGKETRERVFKDYEQLAGAVEKGEVDVAIMGPLAWLRIDPRANASLLLRTVRKGRSTYRAVLFAKPGSPLKNLEALKKAKTALKVGWVDTSSATGYVVPKGHLLMNGVNPAQAFSVQDFAGSHDAVCTGVWEGKWDVGATFSNDPPPAAPKANGCENALGKKAETLQVVVATDEIPNDVLVVASTVSHDHAEKLAAAAKKLAASEDGKKTLKDAFLAEGVADVSAADFAPVKKALDAFAR